MPASLQLQHNENVRSSAPGASKLSPADLELVRLAFELGAANTGGPLSAAPAKGRPAVSDRYLAKHRRPWWFLGAIRPPPIVATYMARQPPIFALNPDRLAILNIAHGVYPAPNCTEQHFGSLVAALNDARQSYRGSGRTYHGGLEKFEPREMEALPVPAIFRLRDGRLLFIECKVSNSVRNSIKRRNDVSNKARAWREEFGNRGITASSIYLGRSSVTGS